MPETRESVIERTVTKIRSILSTGITPENMTTAGKALAELTHYPELFSRKDFPLPTGGKTDETYLLHQDDYDGYALYINSGLPGTSFRPHDHGSIWAMIASIEGTETHTLYTRVDDGSDNNKAELTVDREIDLVPGGVVTMLPPDIHSIQAVGDDPILHFHMYQKAFHLQEGRTDYDLEKGIAFQVEDKSDWKREKFSFN